MFGIDEQEYIRCQLLGKLRVTDGFVVKVIDNVTGIGWWDGSRANWDIDESEFYLTRFEAVTGYLQATIKYPNAVVEIASGILSVQA